MGWVLRSVGLPATPSSQVAPDYAGTRPARPPLAAAGRHPLWPPREPPNCSNGDGGGAGPGAASVGSVPP